MGGGRGSREQPNERVANSERIGKQILVLDSFALFMFVKICVNIFLAIIHLSLELNWAKNKAFSTAIEFQNTVVEVSLVDTEQRLEMRLAVWVKYGSINRHSAINFNLSVLIYPSVAAGSLAVSNVL